ncbi:MAG: acyl--CoA ligase [Deltaproteobacteria bacterium]|nr:acyl--CoA ligase [Deltaproteobacteria bacterium]
MLIQDYLIKAVSNYPEKEVIIAGKKRLTYNELLRDSGKIAAWLMRRGLKAGDRAGILMDEPMEYVKSYFGILLAGGVVVAMNSQTTVRSLTYQANNCEISFLLSQLKFVKYVKELSGQVDSLKNVLISSSGDEEVPEKLSFDLENLEDLLQRFFPEPPSFPAVDADGLAQIIYTSGTTGEPNGVMLRHRNLIANTNSIVKYLELTEADRVMAVLPFFYSYGNSLLLTHIAVGGSIVVNQHFLYPNVILDEMAAEKVTGFSGVPSTFAILLNRSSIREYQFPSLRYVTQAGGAMSPKLAREISNILPETDVYIMYGQTEASARLSYLEPEKLISKAGSIGKAIPGVTLNLLDAEGNPVPAGEVGEIVAEGENIMAGYWENPERTARVLKKEGLWTGDLAKKDEEGYFYIVSRKSEMIKSGAHRISPKEIEEVIHEHASVHEVAVIGIKDETLGEKIKACIVLKEGFDLKKMEIMRHCKQSLPPFKIPHDVEFMAELPKTTSGKIRKKELLSA